MVFIVFFIRVPLRSIQMYDALQKAGNEKAVLVTYPELGHGCWDEAQVVWVVVWEEEIEFLSYNLDFLRVIA